MADFHSKTAACNADRLIENGAAEIGSRKPVDEINFILFYGVHVEIAEPLELVCVQTQRFLPRFVLGVPDGLDKRAHPYNRPIRNRMSGISRQTAAQQKVGVKARGVRRVVKYARRELADITLKRSLLFLHDKDRILHPRLMCIG